MTKFMSVNFCLRYILEFKEQRANSADPCLYLTFSCSNFTLLQFLPEGTNFLRIRKAYYRMWHQPLKRQTKIADYILIFSLLSFEENKA